MAKLPEKDDPSTTSYGRKFLALGNMVLQRAKEEKDVTAVLRKYWVGPERSFVPVSHRAFWLDDGATGTGARMLFSIWPRSWKPCRRSPS